jgi:hypothetical protein
MTLNNSIRPSARDGEDPPVPAPAADPAGSADLATWVAYFNDLEAAMHDFEVGLSQHDIAPLRPVNTPAGHPPEQLRERSSGLYTQITELEFRARVLREEVRAEFARLPRGGRMPAETKGDWDFGSSLDIRG